MKVFPRVWNLNQHSRRCDSIGKICREEHEHKLLDKTFDSVDEAMAFVFDNELDAEFSRRSNDANRRRYVAFACARNKHSGKYHYQVEAGRLPKSGIQESRLPGSPCTTPESDLLN